MPADPLPQDVAPPGGAAVRRSRPIYRVFVSSTWLDLQLERRALMEALNRMEEMRFVGMEFFGNRPDDTHDASIDQVDLCEVFVGIIGHRYGSGITEAEYRRARALNLPCFVYFKRGEPASPEQTDKDPALAAKLAAFKQDLLRGHTVKEVGSPEELAASATADLHNWVAARWISLEREEEAARPRPEAAGPDRTNLLRLLDRIQHDWIEGVLEASLHRRAWIDLGLDWKDEAVEQPWDRILVAPDRPVRTLDSGETIAGVFGAAQDTLLILGEPGAGKTTTLLELARALVARARKAAGEAVPVVLALSTWTGRHRALGDWLVEEVNLRYQVPRRLTQGWLDSGRLVLLLDGLDEVREDLRPACVAAINDFVRDHTPAGLAVTCRVAEYGALKERLGLRAAICLQPLTPAQIDTYLQRAGPGLANLRVAMQSDQALGLLAQSPLMLSVMTMAWRDAPAAELRSGTTDSIEQRRKKLFDGYVQTALRRKGAREHDDTARGMPPVLSWLAGQMRRRGQTLFAVEQLQPDWLDGNGLRFGYFLVTRVLMALGLALPCWGMTAGRVLNVLPLVFMLLVGALLAVIDFSIFRWGRPETLKPWHRVIILMIAVGFFPPLLPSLLARIPGIPENLAKVEVAPLAMFSFLLCACITTLTDVKSRDIRPVDVIGWSWRQGGRRTALVLLGLQWFLIFGFVETILLGDWATAVREFALGRPGFWPGVAAGLLAAGVMIWRWKPREWFPPVVLAGGLALAGGELGQSVAGSPPRGLLAITAFLACLSVIFGGLTSGIDETRARRTGVWFWLKIPLLAGLTVAVVIGGAAVGVGLLGGGRGSWQDLLMFAGIGAGFFGLVAFFRFGGFQGMQHFVLCRLLTRSGRLPAKPGAFFDQAVRLHLMQRVGFGYRFIHALLLDYFADMRGANGRTDGKPPA